MRQEQRAKRHAPATCNPIYLGRIFNFAMPCPASEAAFFYLVEKRHTENIPGKRLIALEEI